MRARVCVCVCVLKTLSLSLSLSLSRRFSSAVSQFHVTITMRACDIALRGTYEGKLGIIGQTIMENYSMIALAILVLVLTAYLIWLLIGNAISIVRTYRRFTKRVDSSVSVNVVKDKSDDVIAMQLSSILLTDGGGAATSDDYLPAGPSDDADFMDVPPEGTSIQKKIDEIKNIYAAYNKEITDHARNVDNKEPTDIMDERILSKDQDVY